MSPSAASICWWTPQSLKSAARRLRPQRRRNGRNAAMRICSTKRFCKRTKAAISISCATRGRGSCLSVASETVVMPAKAGHPVIADARDRTETARRTGSSAFADDDVGADVAAGLLLNDTYLHLAPALRLHRAMSD